MSGHYRGLEIPPKHDPIGNHINGPGSPAVYSGTSNKTGMRPFDAKPERNRATMDLALKTIRNKIQSDNPNLIKVGRTTLRGDEAAAVNRKLGLKHGASTAAKIRRVKAYQRKHGLTVDGIVGRQTLNAMGIRSGKLPGS